MSRSAELRFVGGKAKLAHLYGRLTWGFLAVVVSFFALGAVGLYSNETNDPVPEIVALLLVGAMLMAAIFYYVYLGKCAGILGRSRLVWVGLTILTNPFGFLFSYFMMRARIRAFL